MNKYTLIKFKNIHIEKGKYCIKVEGIYSQQDKNPISNSQPKKQPNKKDNSHNIYLKTQTHICTHIYLNIYSEHFNISFDHFLIHYFQAYVGKKDMIPIKSSPKHHIDVSFLAETYTVLQVRFRGQPNVHYNK
jgi:hypothetical protein